MTRTGVSGNHQLSLRIETIYWGWWSRKVGTVDWTTWITYVCLVCAVCCAKSLWSWLCHPEDCSLPGSSVHGILQARILEWVAMPSSRESSQTRDWTIISFPALAGGFFTTSTTLEVLYLFKVMSFWNFLLCATELDLKETNDKYLLEIKTLWYLSKIGRLILRKLSLLAFERACGELLLSWILLKKICLILS